MSAKADDADVVSNFIGTIPFGYAIGAPLKAIVEGQSLAALSSLDFIQKVGFEGDGNNKDAAGSSSKSKVRTVNFDLKSGDKDISLEAPFLSMVNVPFIRIQQAVISLDCKVHSVVTDNSHSESKKNLGGHATFSFFAGVSANVSYSSTKDSHSSLERNGEVKVNVIAVQDEMPEGLRALLGLMRDALDDSGKKQKPKNP